MLKGIAFLLFGIGVVLMIPKYVKQYKAEKDIENLLILVGIILLGGSSIVLGIIAIYNDLK
ncbi:hypothetical protein [Veillonella criceti]|uniref:Uncharacterized protein n=1 Tax=Veillonella criceti TaxID=103891 RepID=A0A380NJ10_9FIRM|nr:hypothetical protein [Veillonella criceti]SUP41717.1 Uncharacterised protein [Veillonella criceti]